MARVVVLMLVVAGHGCGTSGPEAEDDTGTTMGGASTTGDDPLTGSSPSSAEDTSNTESSTSGDASTTTTTSSTTHGESSSTGEPACDKRVVLMGYWPPTNEMLRPWSTNLVQNPDGWTGENWGGHGYDVYSFFPEFPPDGDPSNDEIGQDGSVGSPEFDLRVDYQATSEDFWRIVDEQKPVILVTTSRGGDIGWEIEGVEGGHGIANAGDPSLDWTSDAHGRVVFPTQASIEDRSWDAISTYRQGITLPTALPTVAIFDATSALALTSVVVDENTSGNYLSGFLGLHGLYWHANTPGAIAAGHIHVGFALPVEHATTLIETTLDAILQEHPADLVECR